MPPALWFLMRLRLWGWLRVLGRALRTMRGGIVTVLGTLLLVLWLGFMVVMQPAATAEHLLIVRRVGPALVLFFTLLNLVTAAGQRAISFSPAEVNLLFPAPLSRHQLVVYKVVITFAASVFTALFLTLFLQIHFNGFLAGLVAMTLMILFLQLFSMALALVAEWVGAQLYNRRRLLVVAALAVLLGLVVWQQGSELLEKPFVEAVDIVSQTPVFWLLLAPFRWLVETATASVIWPDLIVNASLSMLANGVILVLVLALDRWYLEAAATASEQVYKQIEQMRRGGPAALRMSKSGKASFSLPGLPRWGGVGPLIWRQLTAAIRSPWWLMVILIFSAMVIMPALLTPPPSPEAQFREGIVLGMGITIIIMMFLMVPPMLPFDFRGDLDRMDQLKLLPLPTWRLVMGQLLAPVLLITVVQTLLLLVLLPAWGELELRLLAALPFLPSVNLFIFAIENIFFLLFPTRLVATSPGDFHTLGRHMLLWLVKFLATAIVFGGAFGLALLAFLLLGHSWTAALTVAWLIVTVTAAGMVPLVGFAFDNFDVSRDVPA